MTSASTGSGVKPGNGRGGGPPRVHVIIGQGCPFCAAVVREARKLEAADPDLRVAISDVSEVADLVARHHIASVPTTIVDDTVVITGQVTAARLREVLDSSSVEAMATERLRGLFGEQQIDEVVHFLRHDGPVTAIVPLLRDGTLGERVAVLMAIQQAHEDEPGCLADLVPALIGLLGNGDSRLRGDTADLLGTLGDQRAVEALRALRNDPDPEVVEAAEDALEQLGENGPEDDA